MTSRQLKASLYLSTAVSLGAAMPSVAWAQAADSSETGVQAIEQVVVTATRREERLQDVPISISVFNQQQLSNNNITTADQLATYTPSLSADNRFGPENSTFAIRGFTQEIRTSPSVGVFFADVVAPRGGGTGTPAGDGAGPGMLFDLQNVQVLKGPQGTLFGRNTTGGDVLLVPVKPGPDFGGYVEGSYGNYDMKRIQGVINVPLHETMFLRLGVDHEYRKGYLTNTTGVGPSRFADVDYTAARASFVWEITPDLENYTIASYMVSNTYGIVPRMFTANLASQIPGSGLAAQAQLNDGRTHGWWDVENNLPDARNATRQWQVINTTTWQASDNLTVKNIASFAEYHQIDKADVFGTNFTVPDIPLLTDLSAFGLGSSAGLPFQTSLIYPAASKYTSAQKTITEELQFQGRGLGGKLTWQGGGYMELSDPLANVGTLSPSFAACPLPLTFGNVNQCLNPYPLNGSALTQYVYGGGAALSGGWIKYRDYAVYAQASYDLTDEIKATAGFRYTWDESTGLAEDTTYVYAAGFPHLPLTYSGAVCADPNIDIASNPTCTSVSTQKSDAPTWLLQLQYRPTDTIMTYAKYTRGYRQGSVSPDSPAGLQVFQPEQVDTYEAGAKTSWNGSIPGVFDIAAFYNDFTNQQLQVGFGPGGTPSASSPVYLGAAPTTAILNAGKSRIWGAELDTSISPFEGFRLDLAYSYLNSLLQSFDAASYLATANADGLFIIPTTDQGKPLPNTPENKATVTATYAIPISENYGNLCVAGTFVYQDKYLTTAPSGTPYPYAGPVRLFNFNINWTGIAGSQVDGSIFLTNAFNEKYVTWRSGLYPLGFDSESVGAPRMYGVRIRYNFD